MLTELDKKVGKMVAKQIKSFSFVVKDGWQNSHYPELDDLQTLVNNTIESYVILRKSGKFKEAEMMKEKIKETKYAKEHLRLVMNLDFTKPSQKLKDMAKENKIDLTNPSVLNEFKKI